MLMVPFASVKWGIAKYGSAIMPTCLTVYMSVYWADSGFGTVGRWYLPQSPSFQCGTVQ